MLPEPSASVQINFLVLNRPPQTFNEDVVVEPAAAAQADPDSGVFQDPSKFVARKLHPLIRIEDLRFGNPQRLLQGFQAKLLLQRDRKLPRRNIAAVPIHDDNQINQPVGQTNVGDIADPGLIRMVHRNSFQEIGINLVIRPPRRSFVAWDRWPQGPSASSGTGSS